MLAVSLRDELSMSIFAMQSLSCCSCSKNKQVFVIIYTIHTRREEINPFFSLIINQLKTSVMSKPINFVNFPELPGNNNNNKSSATKTIKPKTFVINRDGTIQLLEEFIAEKKAGL